MVDEEVVPVSELKALPIPYEGRLLLFVRALREFLVHNREYVETTEEYQLRLVQFFGSVRLDSSRKRKRGQKNMKRKLEEQSEKPSEEAAESDDVLMREPYSGAVMEFLRMKLTRKCYVKVLLHLDNRIMPNLARPLLLSDFLVSSFVRGGLLSILALNGLFTLVQEHHLDFPQFYERLYWMLTPEVLEAKYRARFFHLADKFMSSSHIPAYTVAAVAKRLSRLSLTAPADSLPLLLTFVMNLLIRHPDLTPLIHRVEDEKEMDMDPYDLQEPDMRKCGALDSSLWELLSLTSHYNFQIAKLASKLEHRLPEMEYDMSDLLETDIEEVVEAALQAKTSQESTDPVKRTAAVKLFSSTGLWPSPVTDGINKS